MSEQNTNGYYENGDNNNYYQNQDNNNYYNNQDSNQNNGQNNKKNNKGMIAVIIAVAAVVIIVGCTAAITFILGVNSGTTNISSTKETTAEKYADIGSTNSTDTSDSSSTSGSVVVTDVSKVVSNTMPSIVAITSTTVMQSNNYDSIYDYYFGGGDGNSKGSTYEQQAAGSGIIVDQTDSELLIVTNNHVIEDADSLKIQFDGMSSDKAVDGYIKGTDSTKDVAVVAVKLKDIPKATLNTIKKATLGDSDKVSVGEGVVAIGNALGYGQSVTTGIVSAKDREANIENKTMKLLQTDAWIIRQNRIQIILRISFIVLSRIVKLQFKLSMINGNTCFMLRINISYIIRDNHKQCAGKPQCEDGTNGSFWITRYICHCHRKHGDIFSAISFSFFVCFCIF